MDTNQYSPLFLENEVFQNRRQHSRRRDLDISKLKGWNGDLLIRVHSCPFVVKFSKHLAFHHFSF